jgi:hypothetical protein
VVANPGLGDRIMLIAFAFSSPGLGKLAFLDRIRLEEQTFYNFPKYEAVKLSLLFKGFLA